MRRMAVLLAALVAVPAAIQAQMCVGMAPWSAGSIKVGGGLELGDGYTDLFGALSVGKDEGFFVGAGAGVTNYDGPGSQVFLTGGAGKELSQKIGGKLAVCPVANVVLGLKDEGYSYIWATGGLAGGYPLSGGSESLSIVLTGAFQLGLSHASFDGDSDNSLIGIADAGVGFILNNRISLSPLARLYFGDGSDFAFVARANIAIGK